MAQTSEIVRTKRRSRKAQDSAPDIRALIATALPLMFTRMKGCWADRVNGRVLNTGLKLTFVESEPKESTADRLQRREAYIARGLKRARRQEVDTYFLAFQLRVVERAFQEDAALARTTLPPHGSYEWSDELLKYKADLIETHRMPTLTSYRRSPEYIRRLRQVTIANPKALRERLGLEFDRHEQSRRKDEAFISAPSDEQERAYPEPPARPEALGVRSGEDRRWYEQNHHSVRTGKIIFPMNTKTWEREPKPLRRRYPHNKLAHKEQPGAHQRRINRLEAERQREVLLTQNRDDATEAGWESYELAYRHMADGLTRLSWLHLARADWFTRDVWEEDDYDYSDDDPENIRFVWQEEIAEREAYNADMVGPRVEAFYPPRYDEMYDPYLYLDRANY